MNQTGSRPKVAFSRIATILLSVSVANGLSYGQGLAARDGSRILTHKETQLNARPDDHRIAHRHSFSIKDEATETETEITVFNRTTQVSAVFLRHNKAVILGQYRNSSDTVTIIDLTQGIQQDYFHCYRPTVSRSRRFILFAKFYNRHSFIPFGHSSVMLVYDLEQSPSDNRLSEARSSIGYRLRDVGLPVYPQENGDQATYQVLAKNEEAVHRVGARYVWIGEPETVVFVDRHGGDNWLVSIKLLPDPTNAEIKKSIIDPRPFIRGSPGSDEYNARLKRSRAGLGVARMRQDRPGRVVLVLKQRMGRYTVGEIELDLP